MKNKYVFVAVMLAAILVVSMGFTNIYLSQHRSTEEEDFVVVTSFYPMYIAAMNIIGDTDGVVLQNLSEPQTGCLHDFQLTPADMKLLSTADVFVINGGGIESFMEEIAAQYPDLMIVEACEGIELLSETHSHEEEHLEAHSHEEEYSEVHSHDVNAHAWMSVKNYRKQVENIAKGFAKVDTIRSERYLANAGVYDRKLEALQLEQEEVQALTEGQSAIMFHCAYEYLAMDLGLEVTFCMDLDEERQVSAGEVAEVLDIIEEDKVSFIFAEELYGASMSEMVQKEADVEVIYIDPLNRGEYQADSYLEGMQDNLASIRQVME